MKKEIIEILKANVGYTYGPTIRDIADQILGVSPWIELSSIAPKFDTEVLIYAEGDPVRVGILGSTHETIKDKLYEFRVLGGDHSNKVTHWAPKPATPAKKIEETPVTMSVSKRRIKKIIDEMSMIDKQVDRSNLEADRIVLQERKRIFRHELSGLERIEDIMVELKMLEQESIDAGPGMSFSKQRKNKTRQRKLRDEIIEIKDK